MTAELPEGISSIDDIIRKSRDYDERVELLTVYTEHKVSHTLYIIDDAISTWEAAGKPEHLKGDVAVLSEFHEAFSSWEKESLMSKRFRSIEKKVENLRKFVELCEKFDRRFESMGG